MIFILLIKSILLTSLEFNNQIGLNIQEKSNIMADFAYVPLEDNNNESHLKDIASSSVNEIDNSKPLPSFEELRESLDLKSLFQIDYNLFEDNQAIEMSTAINYYENLMPLTQIDYNVEKEDCKINKNTSKQTVINMMCYETLDQDDNYLNPMHNEISTIKEYVSDSKEERYLDKTKFKHQNNMEKNTSDDESSSYDLMMSEFDKIDNTFGKILTKPSKYINAKIKDVNCINNVCMLKATENIIKNISKFFSLKIEDFFTSQAKPTNHFSRDILTNKKKRDFLKKLEIQLTSKHINYTEGMITINDRIKVIVLNLEKNLSQENFQLSQFSKCLRAYIQKIVVEMSVKSLIYLFIYEQKDNQVVLKELTTIMMSIFIDSDLSFLSCFKIYSDPSTKKKFLIRAIIFLRMVKKSPDDEIRKERLNDMIINMINSNILRSIILKKCNITAIRRKIIKKENLLITSQNLLLLQGILGKGRYIYFEKTIYELMTSSSMFDTKDMKIHKKICLECVSLINNIYQIIVEKSKFVKND